MLDDITTSAVFTYFLVFCRIGSGIMMLPSLSEAYMSGRARLIAALVISGLVAPLVESKLPPIPLSVVELFLIVAAEIIIGLLIGSVAKIILSTLHVAGMIISYQIGLAAAAMFDPNQGEQGSIIGSFLTLVAILLIFTTDLHHIFLSGLVGSYHIFLPSDTLFIGGFSQLITKTVAESFLMGVKIAAPQIVVGLLMYLAAGVMGRLMPQMQVFFVIIPLQILIGIFVLMITFSGSMMWFMNHYGEVMANFVGG